MNREDFPLLKKDFIYFNNAATSLKPKSVISKINDYYTNYGVNINRGVDSLGYKTTQKYELVRKKVAQFINCLEEEVVWTRGTTESLNLIAHSFGELINKGDEIIISQYEHNSNYLPWLELAKRKGAFLKIVSVLDDGTLNLNELEKTMSSRTKIVAVNHVSNVFGGTNDLKKISNLVHKFKAYLVVDGAQGIVHEVVDVKEANVDFYAFSAHKMYGPMGVGVLYGKKELLAKMKPIFFGGEMVASVGEKIIYKDAPYKFEAGTMMVPEVIGLGEAIDYINKIGIKKMGTWTIELRNYLVKKLEEIPEIEIYNKFVKTHLIIFNIKGIHAHDIASFLDNEKIIIRSGRHCADLCLNYLNLSSTIRISLAFYNTHEECDKLVEVLKKARNYLDVLFK